MKHFLLLFFSLIFCTLNSFSQTTSNEIEIGQVIQPIKNINYNAPDSTDIVIRLINRGPHSIPPYDSLRFEYSFSQVDTSSVVTSFDYDTTLLPTSTISVGSVAEFVIAKNVRINGSGTASVCVDITGTWQFPSNISKFSQKCSQFLVGIKEVDIKPTNIYFSNSTLFFEMNEPKKINVQVFDITGKLLVNNQLSGKHKQSIPFDKHSKGFYFLKITDQRGNNHTSKFVVNR